MYSACMTRTGGSCPDLTLAAVCMLSLLAELTDPWSKWSLPPVLVTPPEECRVVEGVRTERLGGLVSLWLVAGPLYLGSLEKSPNSLF